MTLAAFAVIVFLQVPVVVVVLAAFSTTSYLTIPPQGLTLSWFGKVLSDPTYLSAIRMSLILACGSTVISLALGVASAYALVPQIDSGLGGDYRLPDGATGSAGRRHRCRAPAVLQHDGAARQPGWPPPCSCRDHGSLHRALGTREPERA